MDISNVVVPAPTLAEANMRTAAEKMWTEFDFFYETGEPHLFVVGNGVKITFGNNAKKSAWNLLVDHSIVLTSGNADEIVGKALEYATPIK
jgi:hypothetical protein